jgi:hypothetical protein
MGGPTLWLFMNALMSPKNELSVDCPFSALILPLKMSK